MKWRHFLSQIQRQYSDNNVTPSYKNEWREASLNKPKLRTYILFKNNFYVVKYGKKYNCKHELALLAQLRAGILSLEMENGRYWGIAIHLNFDIWNSHF